MDLEDFRIPLIVLVSGGSVILLNWLANRGAHNLQRCYTGMVTKVLLTLCLFLFAGFSYITLFVVERGTPNNPFWVAPLFVLLSFLSLLSLIDAIPRSISWDEEGLIVTTLWKGRRQYGWSQVRSLTYNPLLQSWTVKFADESGFMFYDMMRGSDAFLEACFHRHIPV